MKKLVLFLLFVAAAVAGGWLFLANKFEHIVNAEILPKLTQHPEIIYVDPEAVRINKFKFDVSLGNLELFPDNEQFSASFGDVSAHYNPLKDKISFCFCGDKTSFVIGENNYYSKNLKGNFDFGRSLLQGVLSDFNVVFDFADTSLHDETLDKKILDVAGGQVDLSYSKKDGFVNPAIKVDLIGLDMPDEMYIAVQEAYSNLANSLVPPKDSEFELRKKKITAEFYKDLRNIEKKFNNIKETRHSFQLSSNMSEELADNLASSIMNNDMSFLPSLIDSKEFDLSFSYTNDESIAINVISLGITKKENQLEFQSNINSHDKGVLSDQQVDELLNLIVSAFSSIIKNLYDMQDISEQGFMWLYSMRDISDINQYNHISYDFEKNELKHDIRLKIKSSDNIYGFDAVGNFADSKYNGNVKSDRLGESIVAISTMVQDMFDLFAKKPSILNKNEKSTFARVSKLAEYIKDNGFDVAKIFHKGGADNLTPEGKFEADIFVNADPENFSVEINGTKGMEILSDPTLANFMNNLPQQ